MIDVGIFSYLIIVFSCSNNFSSKNSVNIYFRVNVLKHTIRNLTAIKIDAVKLIKLLVIQYVILSPSLECVLENFLHLFIPAFEIRIKYFSLV